MKLIKILLVVAAAYGGYYYYQNNATGSHPLIGTWKSDRDKSMKHFYREGVTEKQETALKQMLGDMELTFTKNEVISVFKGKKESESYTVVSEKDGCYVIKAGKEQDKACIKGNELHMPGSFKNATEVFVRVE